jgi:hypothetical protein
MKNYKNSITNLVLLFIFLIPTTSHAEIDSLWAKSYHFCEDNQSNSLIETIDGGLLMTGNCGPGTGGEGYWDRDYMGMMVKMDQDGDTLWTKFIDLWDGYEGFTGKPLEFDDGGFLLNYNLRYDESHFSGPIFIRTNSLGDTLWAKHFETAQTDSTYETLRYPIKHYGNRYYYVGSTQTWGPNTSNGWIVEIDITTGDSISQRIYGDSLYQWFNLLLKLDDGSFIATGNQQDSDENQDFWVVKLDSSLNIVWEKRYGGEEKEQLYDIIINRNGGFTLVGRTESFGAGNQDGYVVRINDEGTVLWDTTFGGEWQDRLYSIDETADNNLLIVGYTRTSSSSSNQGYWVVKLDESGTFIEEAIYNSDKRDKGVQLVQTDYNEFIINGLRSWDSWTQVDDWLIKFSTDVNAVLVNVESEQASIIDGILDNIVYPLAADTVNVDVDLEFGYLDSASAIGVNFTGISGHLDLLNIDTSASLIGPLNWTYIINDTNDTLITGFYGADPLTESGTLFNLKIAVNNSAPQGLYPIEAFDLVVDEINQNFVEIDGGIYVTHYTLGDASRNGELSYYDAAMILKHLVGYVNLDDLQVDLSDASYNGEVSALDASVVAQFVAQLSNDIPPTDNSSLLTTSEFGGFDDAEFYPGQNLEVEVLINQCSNLLSFELDIEYDGNIMSFTQSVWESPYDDFTIEENNEDGLLRIAGSSGNGSENGSLVKLNFTVAEDFDGEEIEITVSKYRLNENVEGVNVVGVFTKSAMGIENDLIPSQYTLHQNYPNPFNPITTLRYDLPEDAVVNITIYDIMGREIRTLVNSAQDAGFKSIIWNATNDYGKPVSAGVYLYKIQAGEFVQTKKMVLLK